MNKQRIFAIVSVGLAAALGVSWYLLRGRTWVFTFDQQRVTEELRKRFPMHKKYLGLVEVDYENPRVKLTDGSSDIAMGVDVRVDVVGTKKPVAGSADLLSKLAYDAATASFVLRDVRIVDFKVPGISDEIAAKVKGIANELTADRVTGIPVYKLKATDARGAVARLVLQSVDVRDGVLYVTVGL